MRVGVARPTSRMRRSAGARAREVADDHNLAERISSSRAILRAGRHGNRPLSTTVHHRVASGLLTHRPLIHELERGTNLALLAHRQQRMHVGPWRRHLHHAQHANWLRHLDFRGPRTGTRNPRSPRRPPASPPHRRARGRRAPRSNSPQTRSSAARKCHQQSATRVCCRRCVRAHIPRAQSRPAHRRSIHPGDHRSRPRE